MAEVSDVATTGLPDPGSAGAELMADEALRLAMRGCAREVMGH